MTVGVGDGTEVGVSLAVGDEGGKVEACGVAMIEVFAESGLALDDDSFLGEVRAEQATSVKQRARTQIKRRITSIPPNIG